MASKKTTAKAVATKKAAKPEAPVLQQVFKTVDDLQRKDTGCTSEIDYTEQSLWLLNSRCIERNRSQCGQCARCLLRLPKIPLRRNRRIAGRTGTKEI